MRTQELKQQLEEYFAKTYPAKYIEFGGYFFMKSYKVLGKSPMEKYFSSGKYKELNDPRLEEYWTQIKKKEKIWNSVVISIIVLFYLLNRE